MPSKKPVITVTAQSEDGPLQVEVAIPLRPRHSKRSPGPQVTPGAESPEPPRIPRVTRLMALAIKFQDMLDRGEVQDYADLARLGYVTRARLTQIMNMLNLAPDIQAEILGTDGLAIGNVSERRTRLISKVVCWNYQRRAWLQLKTGANVSGERRIVDPAGQAAVRVK